MSMTNAAQITEIGLIDLEQVKKKQRIKSFFKGMFFYYHLLFYLVFSYSIQCFIPFI